MKRFFQIRCQDATPVNILSLASLDDLNSRLDTAVSMGQFGANIHVDGCEAYQEVKSTNKKYLHGNILTE